MDRTLSVRPALPLDARSVVEITVAEEGGDKEQVQPRIANEIDGMRDGEPWVLLIAEEGGRIVGFARARHVEERPEDALPGGWYLLGVVVASDARRRGIASALTRARLAWIGERAPRAFSFVRRDNRPAIEMHARLGFEELTRDFAYPRSGLERGSGILYVIATG